MNAIEITGLYKQNGPFKMENLNLSVPKGYVTGLIGENGAGKSTLINHLIGLMKPDQGQINILDSRDIEEDRVALMNRIGLVFAEDNFPEHLTPKKLEKLLAVFYDRWDKHTFEDYLKAFNVSGNTKISGLSTGEKVKLSLAIALSHHAELLILDEPTSNLDPTFRMEILDILQDLMIDEEVTILFSTHITSDLERIADYIVMIEDGAILFNLEKDKLLETYKKVKGPTEILDEEVNALLIGRQTNALGFEAMSRSSDTLIELFGSKVMVESLTVDEVMYFTKKDKRGV